MTLHHTVVALTGNPRPGSRTADAAQATAAYLSAALGWSDPVTAIDLSTTAGELLAAEHPRADRDLELAAEADLLVVATPVHKASFTGLLKAFLDLYGPRGLAGVVTVPLVVPGDPGHSLVGDLHLRPVLVELGAVLPTRSLVVTAGQLGDLDEHLSAFWSTEGPALHLTTAAPELLAVTR